LRYSRYVLCFARAVGMLGRQWWARPAFGQRQAVLVWLAKAHLFRRNLKKSAYLDSPDHLILGRPRVRR
jgi:hypothetical protein